MQDIHFKRLEIDYSLLSLLGESEVPLGATTLVHSLVHSLGNHELSQASIGRKLMEFDMQGLTMLRGRKGRVLTAEGREHLQELKRKLDQRKRNSNLLAALGSNDEKNLIDVLISRRALERENAFLAAVNASSDELESLRELIERQNQALAQGILPVQEDEQFHMAIARMSRNRILYHALRLVWDEGMTPHVTSDIRRSVGSELVVDHVEICKAIENRDPEGASEAMTEHINQIIEDVKIYFSKRPEPFSVTSG